MNSIVESIKLFVHDDDNHNQDPKDKNKFIQGAKEGKPSLRGVGISNGALKKHAKIIYKEHKNTSFQEVLADIDQIITNSKILEENVLAIYLLEKYRKHYSEKMFTHINKHWIDLIDYWVISDHLCINIFKHFPILESKFYYDEINSWRSSDNFWRRRLSLTTYLYHARHDPRALPHLLDNLEYLKDDSSYYVNKAISWMLKECTRNLEPNRDAVAEFVNKNIQYFNKTQLRDSIKYLDDGTQKELLESYDQMKKRK